MERTFSKYDYSKSHKVFNYKPMTKKGMDRYVQ